MCVMGVGLAYGQVVNPLDSMRQQFEKDVAQMRMEFEEYEAKARADYFRYVESIKNVWGGDTVVDNTKRTWVEYDKDYRSRSIVDFEHGNVMVEVAVEDADMQDTLSVNRRLVEAVERMLKSRGSTCPYPSSVDKSEPLTERPILDGLIDLSVYGLDEVADDVVEEAPRNARPAPPQPTVRGKNLNLQQNQGQEAVAKKNKREEKSKGKTLAEKRLEGKEKAARKSEQMKASADKYAVAKKIVAQSPKVVVATTKGADGKERKVVQVQMALVADNLSRNATLYKDLVSEFSVRFQIEEPLIYAIMEQESAFNPQATSWVPAYGLMQLVPRSGGRDAYRFVYKVDRIPEVSYLYNPRNNIELGTAYLRVLMNQFERVTDPHCRRLCVIAGYNTGAGNVSRSFIGSTNLSKAFSSICQFDYEGLYNHLVKNLPHEETRNYVVKVTQRREKYIKK